MNKHRTREKYLKTEAKRHSWIKHKQDEIPNQKDTNGLDKDKKPATMKEINFFLLCCVWSKRHPCPDFLQERTKNGNMNP